MRVVPLSYTLHQFTFTTELHPTPVHIHSSVLTASTLADCEKKRSVKIESHMTVR